MFQMPLRLVDGEVSRNKIGGSQGSRQEAPVDKNRKLSFSLLSFFKY